MPTSLLSIRDVAGTSSRAICAAAGTVPASMARIEATNALDIALFLEWISRAHPSVARCGTRHPSHEANVSVPSARCALRPRKQDRTRFAPCGFRIIQPHFQAGYGILTLLQRTLDNTNITSVLIEQRPASRSARRKVDQKRGRPAPTSSSYPGEKAMLDGGNISSDDE